MFTLSIRPGFLVACLAALVSAAPFARGDTVVYDAAGDFSASMNPNGVWSYGWSQTLGSTFVADASHTLDQGVDLWNGVIPGAYTHQFPYIGHNGSSAPITFYSTAVYQPGQLTLHPGPTGEYADVRFTTPTAGTYALAADFIGVDLVGTTTDVHILLNGVSIFDGAVNGYGVVRSFESMLTLEAGDVLDFVVGYGSNRSYLYDSTALSATLTFSSAAVPEPSSLLLLGVAAAAIVARHGRLKLNPPCGPTPRRMWRA